MSDTEKSIPQTSLHLKNKKVEEKVTAPEPKPRTKPIVQKQKKPGHKSGSFGMRFLGMSIGTFLVAGSAFGAFIYHQVNDLEILTPQQLSMTRGIVVVAFFVILVIEAFTEDLLQGVLSLFLPPYAFVYGLLFADAGPIRGLTMAMLVFLGAEVYFTPDDALVPKTTNTINAWIDTGQQKLIDPDRKDAGFE